MRSSLTPISLSLLFLASPLCALAATANADLTPEQREEQQWETECRATLPYGQGDLEAALLFRLRQCINDKRNAKAIAEKLEKERKRLSDRNEREKERREAIRSRSRTSEGVRAIIERQLSLRSNQGKLFQQIRTRSNYQRIHSRVRSGTTKATTED
jgi:hypothetical protein